MGVFSPFGFLPSAWHNSSLLIPGDRSSSRTTSTCVSVRSLTWTETDSGSSRARRNSAHSSRGNSKAQLFIRRRELLSTWWWYLQSSSPTRQTETQKQAGTASSTHSRASSGGERSGPFHPGRPATSYGVRTVMTSVPFFARGQVDLTRASCFSWSQPTSDLFHSRFSKGHSLRKDSSSFANRVAWLFSSSS